MNTYKISPEGIIVRYTPELSTIGRPWHTIHTPDLPESAARKLRWTDDEVKSWTPCDTSGKPVSN